MKQYRFYRFFLWKAYFDEGWSITNYVKYAFAFGGIFDFISGEAALYLGGAYIISCFVMGWVIYHSGMKETILEINNRYNPLAKELRRHIGKRLK